MKAALLTVTLAAVSALVVICTITALAAIRILEAFGTM